MGSYESDEKRLQWDTRLGGKPRLVFASDQELMQIPKEIQSCVAFIGCEVASGGGKTIENRWAGTVFFVSVTVEPVKNKVAVYAVTAAHVIDEIKLKNHECIFRLNTGSGVAPLKIPVDDWIKHSDARVDVAVTPFPGVGGLTTHKWLGIEGAITPEIIANENVGPGDELFFPGMFSRNIGEAENMPIIRTGSIAAIPSEPIETRDKKNRRWRSSGYLAEARSIGGLSGSPVFVNLSGWRQRGDTGFGMKAGPQFYLLGLVHGHYDIVDIVDMSESEADFQARSLNMGIAIIVSAQHIIEVLNYPVFKEPRDAAAKELLAVSTPDA